MKSRSKGPTRETCNLVDARANYACEICGTPIIENGSRHHRQLRRHGDHTPANLLLVCGSGTTGCHGKLHANPTTAYAIGAMLKTNHHAYEIPLYVYDHETGTRRWAAHTTVGGRIYLDTVDAIEQLTNAGLLEEK